MYNFFIFIDFRKFCRWK